MMGCMFCDGDAYIENELAYARFDRYPVSEGHVLVIPKKHRKNWFDLTEEEQYAIVKLISQLKDLLDKKYLPDGYNIGINCGAAAGQTIAHAHVHIIPRYQGDMKDPRGGVRGVIPEQQKY